MPDAATLGNDQEGISRLAVGNRRERSFGDLLEAKAASEPLRQSWESELAMKDVHPISVGTDVPVKAAL